MDTIGSRGPDNVNSVGCVVIWEPQLKEMWCVGSGNVTRKIHPTAQVEVGAGTVGEFMKNYFAENRRRILIIGKFLST